MRLMTQESKGETRWTRITVKPNEEKRNGRGNSHDDYKKEEVNQDSSRSRSTIMINILTCGKRTAATVRHGKVRLPSLRQQ